MLEIKNLVRELPWNSNGKRWSKRGLRDINKIVIHQSLVSGATLHGVNRYHVNTLGWPHIGYHFCITTNGSVYKTNAISNTSYHCRKCNSSSIGIMVAGNFDGPTHVGVDTPTEAQLSSLSALLDALTVEVLPVQKLPFGVELGKNNVYGHCDLSPKENCPGNMIYSFLQDYKA